MGPPTPGSGCLAGRFLTCPEDKRKAPRLERWLRGKSDGLKSVRAGMGMETHRGAAMSARPEPNETTAPETPSSERDRGAADSASDAPESPTEVTKESWRYVARRTLREFSKDQCTDLAA